MGLLVTAGWIVAAGVATAVSWSAVSVARSAVDPVLAVPLTADSSGSGSAGPGTATAPTTTPPPSRRSGPAAPATPAARPATAGRSTAGGVSGAVVASGAGGSVTFRCAGSTPDVLNITPRQGYSRKEDDSGSGEVRFESDSHRTDSTLSCPGGVPRWSASEKADGGGNSGKGGGSGQG
jgi:hypothetical protein